MSGMDLVEFLAARLDEDEEAAREAVPRRWFSTDNYLDDVNDGTVARFEIKADARHAARHDPAHVLAECEAKRIIVAEHGRGEMFNDCRRCAPWETAPPYETPGTVDFPCRTVRALALPYADHPDYRQEWAL